MLAGVVQSLSPQPPVLLSPTARPLVLNRPSSCPQDWEWSPNAADNNFVAYQAEQGNLPARVALVHLPGREELRQKNLFSVAGATRLLPCLCGSERLDSSLCTGEGLACVACSGMSRRSKAGAKHISAAV